MGLDGGPLVRTLSAEQLVAYEGMARFVTVIPADESTDLTGATIEPRDPTTSALVVREALCSAASCAVQLEILDRTASRGISIPTPIDAVNDFLRVRLADGDERDVLITVWPLDTISGSGSPAPVRGTVFASSASSAAGGTFVGAPRDPQPIRWLVMGDVALAGDLDVVGTAAGAIGGGGAGAVAGADAPGSGAAGGGAAGGPGSGGGGGGGTGSAGEPGAGVEGGAAGEPTGVACATDFTAITCGGAGGGGGADAAGGAGGGTMVIASLGSVSISGAIRAGGAPGEDGAGAGGGGGGGEVSITGASVEVSGIDVAGGQGGSSSAGGAGGAGGVGRARVADPASAPAADAPGIVAFEVLGADLIVTEAAYVVRGVATPGSMAEVTAIDRPGVTGETIVGADGSFSIPVTLEPGLNRLRITSDMTRAWNGTSFELARIDGSTTPQPVGGVLDVAYVPAS